MLNTPIRRRGRSNEHDGRSLLPERRGTLFVLIARRSSTSFRAQRGCE
jgi:hypothetical protein